MLQVRKKADITYVTHQMSGKQSHERAVEEWTLATQLLPHFGCLLFVNSKFNEIQQVNNSDFTACKTHTYLALPTRTVYVSLNGLN